MKRSRKCQLKGTNHVVTDNNYSLNVMTKSLPLKNGIHSWSVKNMKKPKIDTKLLAINDKIDVLVRNRWSVGKVVSINSNNNTIVVSLHQHTIKKISLSSDQIAAYGTHTVYFVMKMEIMFSLTVVVIIILHWMVIFHIRFDADNGTVACFLNGKTFRTHKTYAYDK